MRVWCVAWLVLAGCRQVLGLHDLPVDAEVVVHDAPHDTMVLLADAPLDGVPLTIDAPGDAALVCAAGTFNCAQGTNLTMCNGHCFVGCREMVAQSEAKARCGMWGGQLSYSESQADDDCIANTVFGDPGKTSWLGYEQLPNQVSTNAGWSVPGVNTSWVNWRPGEPNDNNAPEDNQENCATEMGAANWNDANCGDRYFWSCRR